MRAAAIGECMVEFSRRPNGGYVRGFGGDTLKVALYLARLGVPVDYVTALGDDPYSDEMLRAWRAEGIGTELVVRVPKRLPGVCILETNSQGERRFDCWREAAPVRELFNRPEAADLAERVLNHDLVYLSGVTLSLYDESARDRLFDLLDRFRARGGRVAFDSACRLHGWPDPTAARQAFAEALKRVDIALSTFEDEQRLFGDSDPEATARRLQASGVTEIVVKRGSEFPLVGTPVGLARVPADGVAEPVDISVAGDGFNAGYLAARAHGLEPQAAARRGHLLAGQVIRHRSAIVLKAATPTDDEGNGSAAGVAIPPTRSMESILTMAPVVPVLTVERVANAVPLARALVAGGLRVLEITLRTGAALDAARAILQHVPEAIVGLGTLLDPEDIAKAGAVGAHFGVSPGLTVELARAALSSGLPFLPGAATASDVMRARALGFKRLKFFPAAAAGGRGALRSFAGPFPDVRFCPTGGVAEDRVSAYLALSNVLSVGGSWLAPTEDIAAGAWDIITERARRWRR